MRIALCATGVVALTAGWASLWLDPGGYAFSRHMLVHMTVVAIAAPLLAFGISGTRFDPVSYYPKLFPSLLISLVELAVVWFWHTPWIHMAARENGVLAIAEQVSFLISGLWLWLAVLGAGPVGIVALLLTVIHMTLLGAILALAPRELYLHHHHHGSSLEDQHLGGAIMLVIGGVSYLAGGLWMAFIAMTRGTPATPSDPHPKAW